MIKIAGVGMDIYSDMTAAQLVKIAGEIPEWVKKTEMLTPDDLALLSDGEFAICIATKDGEFIRRFPIFDAAHTWLSVHYFIENKNKLPERARAIAAENILKAAEKWASNDSMFWENMDILRKIRDEVDNGVPYATNKYKEGPDDNIDKMSDLESFAKSASNHYVETKDDAAFVMRGIEQDREIAESKMHDDDFAVVIKTASGDVIQRAIPITNQQQIKTAEASFDSNYNSMHPFYKREYAQALVKAAEKHNVKIASKMVAAYASDKPGDMLKEAIAVRMQNTKEDEMKNIASEMLKKASMVSPDTMATSLALYDELTGLDKHWGRLIPDPYMSVFGTSFEKNASDDGVSEDALIELANNSSRLEGYFGADMLKAFKDNPLEFYNALPKPHQEIIKRFLQQ